MTESENKSDAVFYNAVNIALNADFRKISALKELGWQKAWEKIQSDFPSIDPEKEIAELQKENVRLVLAEDKNFPEILKQIPWTPLAIYIKGDFHPTKSVAIVGTRKAGPVGKNSANSIAKNLAKSGLQIISGLAMGVDEAAHKGALDGDGKTTAVLPTGIGNIYPKQNINLAKNIIEKGGALISEFPIHYRPYPSSFIQRNRIISGLSCATIIVEAPEKSGALATARFALEQDREIFVLPGPVNNSNYKGSHLLIRQGARLATCAEDVLEDLGIENNEPKQGSLLEKASDEEKTILEAINQLGWPASVDKIAETTKIQVQKVNQIIAFLTIKGILK